MASHRPPLLDRLEFGRTAAIGGALAGLLGGVATVLLLLPRAVLLGLPAEAGLVARAALVGSREPLAGLLLHLGAATLVGGFFGWRSGVRSGLELSLRGLLLAVGLWLLGWLVLPLAAPELWRGPMAPSVVEYLLFGALLGLQSRLCRRMLQRQWRAAAVQARRRAGPAAPGPEHRPSHAG